jgi:hypothetical protein
MVSVPVRDEPPEFVVYEKLIDAAPTPLETPTVSQLLFDETLHPQPEPVANAKLPLPAVDPTCRVVGDTVKVHDDPSERVKGFDGSLRPAPVGPTALTRTS